MDVDTMQRITNYLKSKLWINIASISLLVILVMGGVVVGRAAAARAAGPAPVQASPIHPTFPLLDDQGENVLDSGGAVSTMNTCGACHDTDFIEGHSFHAKAGLDDFNAPGEAPNSRPWDLSPGIFGKWTPFFYRYLSPESDERLDLGTASWIMSLGERHVGGGPAVYSRDGERLDQIEVRPGDPETQVLDMETGEVVPWDWQESGVVEMNCFLCHTSEPNNEARVEALKQGSFKWANTATLLDSGIVQSISDRYVWSPGAFDDDGNLRSEYVKIQDPQNENCGLCHGLVHDDLSGPLTVVGCSPQRFRTVTTGQIISSQRLSDTGMNLANKDELSRTWDIHAERLLDCTDCHFSLNDPVYFREDESTQPEHLSFDPRRLELGEYLYQPLHQFARGESAQSTVAPGLKDTMRRCESCHTIESSHEWLPYQERHIEALSCETCHIPQMYSNALKQQDWTVLTLDSEPSGQCRGVLGDVQSTAALVVGFEPVWLPRMNVDGQEEIAPFNMVSSWFWVSENPERPVRLIDLEAAWFDENDYHADILSLFDQDGDGELGREELVIDSAEKETLIAGRLEDLGLENPHIKGEIQPYSINHTVTTGEWVIKDCQVCHSDTSRVTQPFLLAAYIPGGVMPEFVADSNTVFSGDLIAEESGELFYQPSTEEQGLYVLGIDNSIWADRLGGFAFLGVLLGIAIHGGVRVIDSMRKPRPKPEVKSVYMYGVYERLWHWLQTVVIVALLATGLIIHKPDIFGIFSFRYVVLVHNVLAAILLVNAVLALFYHVTSGEIRQFIPRPRGFFDQAITQATYYLRGIFRRERHPFEKNPQKKLNPLQQITYFGILNVLLPLQGLTGILIWGAQRWPRIVSGLGGLPFLGTIHSLSAWLFAAFIVLHVYLTTTGSTPLADIKAMIMGWEEIEVHEPEEEEASL